MKFFLLLLAMMIANLTFSQSTMLIDATYGKMIESKEDSKSSLTDIRIILPETKFDTIKIIINQDTIAFHCRNTKGCEPLYASDIDSGRIILHFKDNKLYKIGNRLSLLNSNLNGKDTLQFFNTAAAGKRFPIVGTVKSKPSPAKESSASMSFQSSFCDKTRGDSAQVKGLPDFSFLCGESSLQKCTCGIPIKNGFENMYLPPCFDKNGNAISVKNQLLYDMSQTDPLRKVFLFEIVKGKLNKDNVCPGLSFQHFQFAKIKSSISPRAGDIMAVSVIAPKDSSIVIDSNYVNYFLDSAIAAQNNFNAAGNSLNPGNKKSIESLNGTKTDKDSVAKRIVSETVTLKGDLIQFNNYYSKSNFIQEKYYSELLCMQKKIDSVFDLTVTPHSGINLASAIESRLLDNNLQSKYYWFTCKLLNDLVSLYDSALAHTGNYRIFTQLIQIPNADEITIGMGMKTQKGTDQIYRHNFLIKGGLKIDISTGVFVTGLNNRDYINVSTRLSYRDSTTGPLKDTTGNFLNANKRKINYSTGLLVHVYPRTGGNVNFGGVAGVTFNNSEFMMLLGSSVMFRMGNARLSVVGGAAIGKQKNLDANQHQYLADEIKQPNAGVYIQNDINNRLPRYFTDTNITTYDRLKLSWFFGITYNFASFSLGK